MGLGREGERGGLTMVGVSGTRTGSDLILLRFPAFGKIASKRI